MTTCLGLCVSARASRTLCDGANQYRKRENLMYRSYPPVASPLREIVNRHFCEPLGE